MKKVLFTLVLLLTTVAAALASFRERSILRIRLSDNRPLTVIIDGRNYDRQGTRITIGDLPAGRHRIKIYSYRAYRDGGGGHAKLLYSGSVRTRPGTITYAVLDRRSGDLLVRVRDLDDSYYRDGRFSDNDPDWQDNRNNTPDDRYDDDRDRDHSDRAEQGSFRNNDVEDLRKRADGRIGDTDKLKLMKSALERHTYTSSQVRTMSQWLSFDSSKLDFLKWAYKGTVDKSDYWKLEDVLSFSSSKEEFSDYVKGR